MNLDKIELGTPETALKSCVNLLSRLFEQPEEYVACYLDLYYQVRRRWEESEAPSGAARQLPQGGSQGERVPPSKREGDREAVEGVPADAADVYPAPQRTLNRPTAPGTPQSAEPTAPLSGEPKKDGEPKEDGEPKKDGEAEKAPPKKPRARETYINDGPRRAAEFKRQVRARLMAARQAGRLTTAQILAADTEGEITEGAIWKIVNGHQCGVDVYRSLERVLNRLEAEASINA